MSDVVQKEEDMIIPLREIVRHWTQNFLVANGNLGIFEPSDFYQTFLNDVEEPLLDEILIATKGNQTKAAKMLGLNRGTLRARLSKMYKKRKLKRIEEMNV